MHSDAFSYTNSKVLFAIKRRERYVIMVFLATDGDTDMKTSSFHQSHKLIPIQSVNSNSRRFHSYSIGMCYCYRPEIILYALQTQAAL